MFKNNSIFIKVLINNLMITLMPLILIVSVICFLFCSDYRNREIQATQEYVKEYADEINSALVLSIQSSDYILGYNYIIDGLNIRYESRTELLAFIQNLISYISNISGSPNHSSMTIYFTNSTLYESQYLLNISRLGNAEEIQNYFGTNNTNIYWEDTIQTDENGKAYFMFYRKMALNKGSILSCKAYIPESPSNIDACILTPEEFANTTNYISVPLNSNYIVAAPLDYDKIRQMYVIYILLFTTLGICFIFTIAWLAYKITLRITSDTNSFISQLDVPDVLTADISLNTKSTEPLELTVIKKSINSLMLKVKEISDSQYRSELEKRKLELHLLQSKINPHILYNSLSVIKLKVFKYKDTELLELLDHLVNYYHAILGKGKTYVTISEEIEMIKNFVYINEISHNKKYNLEIDIPEELTNQEILHLMLQPFVENAIIHGLAGSRKNCKIKISCHCIEDMMEFTVYDNGYGLSPEKLEQLNRYDFKGGSYGIKNVCQRLCLEYGQQSTIQYSSEKGVFTQVTLRFQAFQMDFRK